ANMASKRRTDYEDQLAKSQKAKLEAEAAYSELKKKLDGLSEQVEEIKRSTQKDIEIQTQALIDSANSLAAHVEAETTRMSEAKLESARLSLRKDLVDQAIGVAKNELKGGLNNQQQLSLIRKDMSKISEFTQH